MVNGPLPSIGMRDGQYPTTMCEKTRVAEFRFHPEHHGKPAAGYLLKF